MVVKIPIAVLCHIALGPRNGTEQLHVDIMYICSKPASAILRGTAGISVLSEIFRTAYGEFRQVLWLSFYPDPNKHILSHSLHASGFSQTMRVSGHSLSSYDPSDSLLFRPCTLMEILGGANQHTILGCCRSVMANDEQGIDSIIPLPKKRIS